MGSKIVRDLKEQQLRDTPKAILEDLFDDMYKHRVEIYKMNFIRGIFFGFGTLIGGTIVLALLLWLLSWFNQVPFIGDFVRTVQHSIDASRK